MSNAEDTSPEGGPPQAKRQRVSQACGPCRDRKTRCDGRQPVCVACEDRGVASTCNFDYVRRQRTRHSNAGEKKRQGDRALPSDPATRRDAAQALSDLGNGKQQNSKG